MDTHTDDEGSAAPGSSEWRAAYPVLSSEEVLLPFFTDQSLQAAMASPSGSRRPRPPARAPPPELRLVLLGRKGAGKSAAGNTILGVAGVFESGRPTEECVKRRGEEAAGRRVTVVDTPGWEWYYPLNGTPNWVRRETLRSVALCPPGPHALLLAVRSCASVNDAYVREMEEHLAPLGGGAWEHAMLLFTRGDELGLTSMEQRIGSGGPALGGLLRRCGGRYHVLDNLSRGKEAQVKELLRKVELMVEEEEEKKEGKGHMEVDRRVLEEVEADERRRARERRKRQRQAEAQMQRGAIKAALMSDGPEGSGLDAHRSFSKVPACLPEVRLILLGERETGKSSAGNVILGGGPFFRAGAATEECARRQAEVSGRLLTVVDTPGWEGGVAGPTPERVRREVAGSVALCAPGPHALLLTLRADTLVRAGHVTEHLELLGEGAWRHTLLLFTHGDQLREGVDIGRHIRGGGRDLQGLLERCGGRYHVVGGGAWEAAELLEKVERMAAANRCQAFSGAVQDVRDLSRRRNERFEQRLKEMADRMQRQEAELKRAREREMRSVRWFFDRKRKTKSPGKAQKEEEEEEEEEEEGEKEGKQDFGELEERMRWLTEDKEREFQDLSVESERIRLALDRTGRERDEAALKLALREREGEELRERMKEMEEERKRREEEARAQREEWRREAAEWEETVEFLKAEMEEEKRHWEDVLQGKERGMREMEEEGKRKVEDAMKECKERMGRVEKQHWEEMGAKEREIEAMRLRQQDEMRRKMEEKVAEMEIIRREMREQQEKEKKEGIVEKRKEMKQLEEKFQVQIKEKVQDGEAMCRKSQKEKEREMEALERRHQDEIRRMERMMEEARRAERQEEADKQVKDHKEEVERMKRRHAELIREMEGERRREVEEKEREVAKLKVKVEEKERMERKNEMCILERMRERDQLERRLKEKVRQEEEREREYSNYKKEMEERMEGKEREIEEMKLQKEEENELRRLNDKKEKEERKKEVAELKAKMSALTEVKEAAERKSEICILEAEREREKDRREAEEREKEMERKVNDLTEELQREREKQRGYLNDNKEMEERLAEKEREVDGMKEKLEREEEKEAQYLNDKREMEERLEEKEREMEEVRKRLQKREEKETHYLNDKKEMEERLEGKEREMEEMKERLRKEEEKGRNYKKEMEERLEESEREMEETVRGLKQVEEARKQRAKDKRRKMALKLEESERVIETLTRQMADIEGMVQAEDGEKKGAEEDKRREERRRQEEEEEEERKEKEEAARLRLRCELKELREKMEEETGRMIQEYERREEEAREEEERSREEAELLRRRCEEMGRETEGVRQALAERELEVKALMEEKEELLGRVREEAEVKEVREEWERREAEREEETDGLRRVLTERDREVRALMEEKEALLGRVREEAERRNKEEELLKREKEMIRKEEEEDERRLRLEAKEAELEREQEARGQRVRAVQGKEKGIEALLRALEEKQQELSGHGLHLQRKVKELREREEKLRREEEELLGWRAELQARSEQAASNAAQLDQMGRDLALLKEELHGKERNLKAAMGRLGRWEAELGERGEELRRREEGRGEEDDNDVFAEVRGGDEGEERETAESAVYLGTLHTNRKQEVERSKIDVKAPPPPPPAPPPGLYLRVVVLGESWSSHSPAGIAMLGGAGPQINGATFGSWRGQRAGRRLAVAEPLGLRWRDGPGAINGAKGVRDSAAWCAPGPHLVLLLVPAFVACTRKYRRAAEEHLALLGDGLWRRTLVVITWGETLGVSGEQHVLRSGELTGLVERCGGGVHVMSSRRTDAETEALLRRMEGVVGGGGQQGAAVGEGL